MARINLIMGMKGGIGKSLIAAALGEYLLETRVKANMSPPILIDLDPNNASFSAIRGLNVQFLDVLTHGEIDGRKFDVLVEQIFKSKKDDVFVIDTGSNAYIPLMSYLVINMVPELLLDSGHKLIIHVPIMGGAEVLKTISCLDEIGQKMPKAASIAVWMNRKNGSIEYKGISFENSETYKTHKDRIISIVKIYEWRPDMATDIAEALKVGKTFGEAAKDANAAIMVRQRMTVAKRYIYQCIEASKVCA